jgi:hypothetical protein
MDRRDSQRRLSPKAKPPRSTNISYPLLPERAGCDEFESGLRTKSQPRREYARRRRGATDRTSGSVSLSDLSDEQLAALEALASVSLPVEEPEAGRA